MIHNWSTKEKGFGSIVHVTLMDASNRIVRDAKVWVNGTPIPFAEHAQGYVKEMEIAGTMALRVQRSGYRTIELGNLKELPSRVYLLRTRATYCYQGAFRFPCESNDDKLLVEVAPMAGGQQAVSSDLIRGNEERIKPLLDSLGLRIIYRYDTTRRRASDLVEPLRLMQDGPEPVRKSPFERCFVVAKAGGGKFRGDEIEVLDKLRKSSLVRMAGPLLCRNADLDYPGMYPGDVFVEFKEKASPGEIEAMLQRHGLGVYYRGEGTERWILHAGGNSRRGMNRLLESLREEACVLRVSPSAILYDELSK